MAGVGKREGAIPSGGIEQTTGSYRMGALWAAWDAAERVAEIGGRCTEGRWGRSCPATLLKKGPLIPPSGTKPRSSPNRVRPTRWSDQISRASVSFFLRSPATKLA
jgi:hypothetical protein